MLDIDKNTAHDDDSQNEEDLLKYKSSTIPYAINDVGYNWSDSKGAAPVVKLHYAAS